MVNVPPELLRHTDNAIQKSVADALAAVKSSYQGPHEDVMQNGIYQGAGATASFTTSIQISDALRDVLTGAQNLASVLGLTAVHWDQQQIEAVQSFNAVLGDVGSHGA